MRGTLLAGLALTLWAGAALAQQLTAGPGMPGLVGPGAAPGGSSGGVASSIANAGNPTYSGGAHVFLDAANGAGGQIVIGTSAGANSALDLTTSSKGLQITDLKGSSLFEYNSWPGVRVEFSDGTAGAPLTGNGSTVKISRYESLSAGACAGNTQDTECNSALSIVATGSATTVNVTTGINVVAQNSSTLAGANPQGINAHGRVTGSGVGVAAGAYLEGRRDTTTGSALGAEISAWNATTSDCTAGYSTIGNCDGIWVSSRAKQATNYTSTAVHIGLGDALSAWKEGITINNNAAVNFAFNDQSSATTSINIAGTHTSSIIVASGAGPIRSSTAVILTGGSAPTLSNGTGYALGAAASGLVLGGQGSVNDVSIANSGGSIVAAVPTGVVQLNFAGATEWTGGAAPSLSNGLGYCYSSATVGLVCGGQGSSNDFSIRNKSGTPILSVGTGGTALSIPSILLTVTPFLGSAGTGGFGGAATLGGIVAGNGSVNDVTIENKSAVAVITIPTGTTNASFQGKIFDQGIVAAGTAFTIASGCGTTGTVTGGVDAGKFTAGQAACAPVFNLPTAPNNWICRAIDLTTPADLFVQTATGTATCMMSATVTSGDTILFVAERGF